MINGVLIITMSIGKIKYKFLSGCYNDIHFFSTNYGGNKDENQENKIIIYINRYSDDDF